MQTTSAAEGGERAHAAPHPPPPPGSPAGAHSGFGHVRILSHPVNTRNAFGGFLNNCINERTTRSTKCTPTDFFFFFCLLACLTF